MTIRGRVYSQGGTPITGAPRVAITVANIREPYRFLNVEFLVDTGFTGYLTLPPEESIGQLGLPKLGEGQAVLAGRCTESGRNIRGLGVLAWTESARADN